MDPMTLAGIGIALLAIVLSTVMDGNSFGTLIGPSSIVMVVLGGLGGALAGFSKVDLKAVPKSMVLAFKGAPEDADAIVTQLVQLAEIARREGVLALEAKVKEIEEPFLLAGLQMVVDGSDEEAVRAVMETEVDAIDARHQRNIQFWQQMGAYAPTFGMLGTVIGLINMLGNLSDAAALGKGMALALLTTLYGVLFSNLFYLPVAAKLARLNDAEMAVKQVALEGVLAIREGVSPRSLAERLEAHLDRDLRVGYNARAGKEAA